MSENKNIDYAAALAMISVLTGSKKLVLYKDPLEEIRKICVQYKDTVKSFSGPIPGNFPGPIDQDVGMELYERYIKNNFEPVNQESEEEYKEDLVEEILDQYEGTIPREYLKDELTSETMEALDQIYQKQDVTKFLDEWSSYELQDLFDQVQQKEKPALINISNKRDFTGPEFMEKLVSKLTKALKNQGIESDKEKSAIIISYLTGVVEKKPRTNQEKLALVNGFLQLPKKEKEVLIKKALASKAPTPKPKPRHAAPRKRPRKTQGTKRKPASLKK